MPINDQTITTAIHEVLEQLVQNWPLYSFVTSNPLAPYEHLPFGEAISEFRKYLNINGYPSAAVFKQALYQNEIDSSLIEKQLLNEEIALSAEDSLARMQWLEEQRSDEHVLGAVDRHMIKWLTVFMDEGSTEWPMPGRQKGFYKAWRNTAQFDRSLPNRKMISSLPRDPVQALQQLMEPYQPIDLHALFKHHLLALPGWTGYIKYRMDHQTEWQQASRISLFDYLAVRLALCIMLNEDQQMEPAETAESKADHEENRLKLAWLRALEQTYQQKLLDQVSSQSEKRTSPKSSAARPEAQLVFCIDTRSERIRRAVEQAGNYETFGYAGFFGIPMDYQHPGKNIRHKSCPPIVDSAYVATDQIRTQSGDQAQRFDFYNNLQKALNRFRFTLKNNIPASFGYVESAGFFYGIGLLLKTLTPSFVHRFAGRISSYIGKPEWFSEAVLSHKTLGPKSTGIDNLSTGEKAEIVQTAFELMGWQQFAPLVVFAGHGSETANNPFGSSLDCGACAGNKGGHNARVMARICNDPEVRAQLAEANGIEIPGDTWFLAAEHNTTTNHIQLYDQDVPESHRSNIASLKKKLANAQTYANLEQFKLPATDPDQSVREAQRRAADWAETRPEWGLAGNASFIIGPRELTSGLNLQARSFLHSYNWRTDTNGEKLTAILKGPMVVTQWINNHYYFAAVDNDQFGSGTKVTQNITGQFGVVQGNGGDLRSGLPLESLQEDDHLQQHLPLRLTVLVHAPKTWVESILSNHNDSLGKLVCNNWIYLAVMDPKQDNEVTFIDNLESASTPVKKVLEN